MRRAKGKMRNMKKVGNRETKEGNKTTNFVEWDKKKKDDDDDG